MGKIRSIHDESWRAARLVVNRFAAKLDDEELIASFHAVREIIAESMRRSFERREQEQQRLGKKPTSEN